MSQLTLIRTRFVVLCISSSWQKLLLILPDFSNLLWSILLELDHRWVILRHVQCYIQQQLFEWGENQMTIYNNDNNRKFTVVILS